MGAATGRLESLHLVVKGLPVARQHMFTGDDDIDFARPGRDRGLDLAQLDVHRVQAGGKPGRHRGHRNVGAAQGLDRRFHESVIDAHRTGRQPKVADAQRLDQVRPQRCARLGAQAPDPAGRVVAVQRRKVDATDRLQQPRRLPVLLHGAARGQGSGPALHRAEIDPHRIDQIAIQGRARIARFGRPWLRRRCRWLARQMVDLCAALRLVRRRFLGGHVRGLSSCS